MIFSLVAMIGLDKCCITSACLQWLCHSGERIVARGPLVYISEMRFLLLFSHFSSSNCIDSGYFVYTSPTTVVDGTFGNFAGVFFIACRCACAIGIFLKSFLVMFSGFELSHFSSSNSIDNGSLVDATPPTAVNGSFWHITAFCHGLKICMCFWYIPKIMFCLFLGSGYLVDSSWRWFFLELCWFYVMVWRYACAFGI